MFLAPSYRETLHYLLYSPPYIFMFLQYPLNSQLLLILVNGFISYIFSYSLMLNFNDMSSTLEWTTKWSKYTSLQVFMSNILCTPGTCDVTVLEEGVFTCVIKILEVILNYLDGL